VIALLLMLGIVLDALPASASPADTMFSATRAARTQSAYAHYSVYATVLRCRVGNRPLTSTWDTIEDMRRRLVRSHALSREENEHPHVPHGTNFGLSGSITPSAPVAPGATGNGAQSITAAHTVNPERPADPIGELTFAVDQDFGLAIDAQSIAATDDMSDVSSSKLVLQHIGRTGTVVRNYEVTDLGDVTAAGAVEHHLRLRPLRDPKQHRLRELWTDAKTSLPVRAIVEGIGNAAPLDSIAWRVDFTQLEGGTYVARETALEPLDTDEGELDDVTITFEEVRPTNRLSGPESVGYGEIGIRDP
jgi:hypothetical protein